jgi:hypothetical protein
VSQPFAPVKKQAAHNPATTGIQPSLTKVQKDEQPCKLNPVQSSEDARNPSGIAASRNARLGSRRPRFSTTLQGFALPDTFIAATLSAAITSEQNGTANHHFIPLQKSIAKRISNNADIANPARSNHC